MASANCKQNERERRSLEEVRDAKSAEISVKIGFYKRPTQNELVKAEAEIRKAEEALKVAQAKQQRLSAKISTQSGHTCLI